MEIDVIKLKRTIAMKNTTLEAVAEVLGVNRSTLYRKLKSGGGGITLSDAKSISEYLGLSKAETLNIFWVQHGTRM
ncbi:MAG: helix-turn-helix transcriptional regulator [Ruminococcaceae bacterium]|nr:helix-turn-helix transcriptional regulator [Oscillospiraceae bacterium]